MNPFMETCNNPYNPVTGLGLTPCFGTIIPDFSRGDSQEDPLANDCGDRSTVDRTGDKVDGDTVYLKGIRIKVCSSENDFQTTAGYPNYWRFLCCVVNSNDGVEPNMTSQQWGSIWRCEASASTSGNGRQLRNTFMALRDRENMGTYKIIRDTKWKAMKPVMLPPYVTDPLEEGFQASFAYTPMGVDWYIPINKRYQLMSNGTLKNFKEINWALMGTWLNTSECPDFELRVDMFYRS